MRPAAEAEKLGIPSVAVTITGFTAVARLAAKAAGVEGLRLAEYPGAVGIDHAEIRRKVETVVFDQIVDGLTRPAVEQSAASPDAWDPTRIAFTGTFDEVNRYFAEREWTDGLPIVPPTAERIEAFLRFTDRARDQDIAILPQANLRANAWNVAANAVMAGCRPEHMPILVAAAEALGDERYNLNNIGTTWGIIPYLLVNGPIVRQLGIECRGQLVSRGPNPALGRALGLIIRNIGGYRPGRNQMGTFGYPLCFAIAENEEDSPWEPLHVERGFAPETSTVSVSTTMNWGFSPSPYTRDDKSGAQNALELLCMDLVRKPCLSLFAERGPKAFINDVTFLLSPSIARTLAAAGHSKADVRRYVHENARAPLRDIDWELRYALAEVHTLREKVEAGLYPPEFLGGPDAMVPIVPSADAVNIVVCGDPARNRMKTLDSGYTRLTTKAVALPARWDALLEEAQR